MSVVPVSCSVELRVCTPPDTLALEFGCGESTSGICISHKNQLCPSDTRDVIRCRFTSWGGMHGSNSSSSQERCLQAAFQAGLKAHGMASRSAEKRKSDALADHALSESSEDEDDFAWEDLDLTNVALHAASDDESKTGVQQSQGISIELNRREPARERRRLRTKLEQKVRYETHKLHLLCLLANMSVLNTWSKHDKVQSALRPLVASFKGNVRPKPTSAAIQRTRVLLEGLHQAADHFALAYDIVGQGLSRALWFEPQDLARISLRSYENKAINFEQFLACARMMEGNRDMGAVLLVTFLRMLKLEARLVCSLQPVALAVTRQTSIDVVETSPKKVAVIETPARPASPAARGRTLSRPRLGAISRKPAAQAKPAQPVYQPVKPVGESGQPIFWAEVFDVAAQKWYPIDPLVTGTVNKPSQLEPPQSDPTNLMSYVLAMEADGSARDVTLRYARHYNAKTRKLRVDSVPGGAAWWAKVMRLYRSRNPGVRDRNAIEDAELARRELQEPPPGNVEDFKNHPHFALPRHLRRDEMIDLRAKECGAVTVARGVTEHFYPRRSVMKLKSVWGWYLLGLEIKPGEQALKHVKARRRLNNRARSLSPDGHGDSHPFEDVPTSDGVQDAAEPLFAHYQTQSIPRKAIGPDGAIPVSRFGTMDLFVDSMLPIGCVHLRDVQPDLAIPPAATRLLAACSQDSGASASGATRRKVTIASYVAALLDVPYAVAVTALETSVEPRDSAPGGVSGGGGLRGRGRVTTKPVRSGVVVREEHAEAFAGVWGRVASLVAVELRNIAIRRAVSNWRRLHTALSIRQHVQSRYGTAATNTQPVADAEEQEQ